MGRPRQLDRVRGRRRRRRGGARRVPGDRRRVAGHHLGARVAIGHEDGDGAVRARRLREEG
jgi:hypothetical protein